jgi:hypothetical protein
VEKIAIGVEGEVLDEAHGLILRRIVRADAGVERRGDGLVARAIEEGDGVSVLGITARIMLARC